MSVRPIHVLQVVSPAEIGGLETVVSHLTGGLTERGLDVTIVAALGHDQPVPTAFAGLESARIIPLRLGNRRVDREYGFVSELSKSADLIHTHGYRPDIVQGALSRSLPIVSTVHGFTGGGPAVRFYEHLQQRALRDFSKVIAVSEPIASRLVAAGVDPARVETIPNAIREPDFCSRTEARQKLDLGENQYVIGWVGRMTEEKNPGLALEAFALARSQLPDSKLVMIGDGPLRSGLQQRENPGVDFVGSLPDASRYMKALDALVLSSNTEGTPLVLLEAMLAGTAIVSTAVGGVPLLVSENEAALVPPRAPSRLAEAIVRVESDARGTAQRVERARRRALERNGFEAWVNRYHDVYRQLTQRR